LLKQRIITALLLVPLVLGALFFLPLKFFALLAALVFLLASREWSAFVTAQPQQWLPLVFCLLLGASLFWVPVEQLWIPQLHPLVMGVLWTAVSWWLLGLLLVLRYPQSARLWRESIWLKSLFGLVTLVPFFWSLVAIRGYNFYHDPMMGAWILLFVMGLVWAADSGAYFFGKAFGKHKLAPAVSPGKTIEGMLGGVYRQPAGHRRDLVHGLRACQDGHRAALFSAGGAGLRARRSGREHVQAGSRHQGFRHPVAGPWGHSRSHRQPDGGAARLPAQLPVARSGVLMFRALMMGVLLHQSVTQSGVLMQNLVILGASGSIGQSTLKVLRTTPGAGRCWR
jgi:CDP-diglyceride synthetase